MNKIGAVFAAMLVLTGATAAFAESEPAQLPDGSQETMAPALPAPPPAAWQGNLPLFTIGQLPVQVWAPVESPYDANMNRNQAANPVWGNEMADSQR